MMEIDIRRSLIIISSVLAVVIIIIWGIKLTNIIRLQKILTQKTSDSALKKQTESTSQDTLNQETQTPDNDPCCRLSNCPYSQPNESEIKSKLNNSRDALYLRQNDRITTLWRQFVQFLHEQIKGGNNIAASEFKFKLIVYMLHNKRLDEICEAVIKEISKRFSDEGFKKLNILSLETLGLFYGDFYFSIIRGDILLKYIRHNELLKTYENFWYDYFEDGFTKIKNLKLEDGKPFCLMDTVLEHVYCLHTWFVKDIIHYYLNGLEISVGHLAMHGSQRKHYFYSNDTELEVRIQLVESNIDALEKCLSCYNFESKKQAITILIKWLVPCINNLKIIKNCDGFQRFLLYGPSKTLVKKFLVYHINNYNSSPFIELYRDVFQDQDGDALGDDEIKMLMDIYQSLKLAKNEGFFSESKSCLLKCIRSNVDLVYDRDKENTFNSDLLNQTFLLVNDIWIIFCHLNNFLCDILLHEKLLTYFEENKRNKNEL